MTTRVAIIDAQTLTRYGLRELISQQPDLEIAGECKSASEAPRMLALSRPDVVTVDVDLPDGDGLRLAREFRDRYAGLGIVVLTSRGQDDVLFRALETGVSAFVAKSAPVEEMLGAIRHAAVAASSFTAAGLAMALARRHARRERLSLSAREAEVLRLLRDGLSIPALARTMLISQSTAKTYVARLYDKLGASNRAQALMTAVQYGLIGYQEPHLPARLSPLHPEEGSVPPIRPARQRAGRTSHEQAATTLTGTRDHARRPPCPANVRTSGAVRRRRPG